MISTLEALNVTDLRPGDRVRVDGYPQDYLVVSHIIVRTAHTEVIYIYISDNNRIAEHRIEYGNSVDLPAWRY